MRERIRVLLADDSKQFCAVVSLWLAHLPQVELVGLVQDDEQALALAACTQPDLVLMDLNIPGLNGLRVTRKFRDSFPEVRVIINKLNDSPELKAASAAAGGRPGGVNTGFYDIIAL